MADHPRVLIIEDDAAIRAGIGDALKYHGYAIEECEGGSGAAELALGGTYDLVLLDLVLPGGVGLDILREVHRYLPTLLRHIQSGDIDPSFVVTHRVSLDDAPRMYRTFRDKQDGCIKVVMKPN
jgi:CheY-like chemotaxis protein